MNAPMNASNRNLLAIALATVLLSPAAWAGKGGVAGNPEAKVSHGAASAGMQDPADVRDESDKKAAPEQEEAKEQQTRDAMTPPPSPPQSQGAENAAPHSDVVQRDVWKRLDADADGRVSVAEAAADPGFNSGFQKMDSDGDGFVSDTEYRSAAKANMEPGSSMGASNAASQSSVAIRDSLSRLDVNADGVISATESDADVTFKANFAAIDANGDGSVAVDEYRAWIKAQRK